MREASKDGATAPRRLNGKGAVAQGIGLGEMVLYRRKPVQDKLTIIGTAEGVWRTRIAQRRPPEDPTATDLMGDFPWNMPPKRGWATGSC